jgi:hypothetical protein
MKADDAPPCTYMCVCWVYTWAPSQRHKQLQSRTGTNLHHLQ